VRVARAPPAIGVVELQRARAPPPGTRASAAPSPSPPGSAAESMATASSWLV
jgi:hypothetical protein